MLRIRHAVLCALTVLMVSAYGVSVASAAPEFKGENKVAVKGTSIATSGTNPSLYTKGAGITIKCTSEESTGEITSATTTAKNVVTYSGCKAFNGGTECGEARTKGGSVAEQIKPHTLKGKLVEVASTEAASEVGLRLEPETGTTFDEIEFKPSCGFFSSTTVTGKVIGEASPIKAGFSTTGKLIFGTASEEQVIKHIKGGTSNEILEAFFFPSAIQDTETVTFGKAIETT
jgi:hypothetical protein